MTQSCFATCDMNTIQTGYLKGRFIGENVSAECALCPELLML